jgi:hypothetical protein
MSLGLPDFGSHVQLGVHGSRRISCSVGVGVEAELTRFRTTAIRPALADHQLNWLCCATVGLDR